MAPSRRVVRDELSNVLAYLLESEIALLTNAVRDEGERVSWWRFSSASSGFLEFREPPSFAGYRAWVANGDFSALLYDGALLQVSYDFVGTVLVAHRLSWVPCPFLVDEELLQVEPVLDVLDLYAGGSPADVVLKTAVRFDFDADRAAPNHPAAHMTINAAHCRIACAAPLRLGHFIDFIFRNFYPDLWQAHPYLGTISRKPWGPHTVTELETELLHVSWRR
jgi:hypothetical protein